MQQQIDESIESYKEALRRNPNDLDTKYNLAYAQMLKKQQEQQQQQQQNQQQNQDQQDQDQQNQDSRIRINRTRISKRIRISRINKTSNRTRISSKISNNSSKLKYHARMLNSFYRHCKTMNAIFRKK
jgi:tetratricopeptide (TPR) repeat protein